MPDACTQTSLVTTQATQETGKGEALLFVPLKAGVFGRKFKAEGLGLSPEISALRCLSLTRNSGLSHPNTSLRKSWPFGGHRGTDSSSVRPATACICTTLLFSLEARQQTLEVGR